MNKRINQIYIYVIIKQVPLKKCACAMRFNFVIVSYIISKRRTCDLCWDRKMRSKNDYRKISIAKIIQWIEIYLFICSIYLVLYNRIVSVSASRQITTATWAENFHVYSVFTWHHFRWTANQLHSYIISIKNEIHNH